MNDDSMPALSIRQPWAELILLGRKSAEIRSWQTDYRGPLLIHAARHVDAALDERFSLTHLTRGAFIGSVRLVSISPIDPARWESWRPRHLVEGRFSPGLYAWFLAEPRRFAEPVAASGQLNLFEPSAEVRERLRQQGA